VQIVVNDEPISFTLENEQTMGQIVDQLEDWLTTQRLAISSVTVDKEELPLYARERWNAHPITNVDRVQVTASTLREMKLSMLRTMLEYLMLLGKGIETHRDAELGELLGEYPYIRASINNLIGVSAQAHTSSALDSLLHESGLNEGAIADENVRDTLVRHIRDIQIVVLDRMKEVTQPEQEAAAATVLLKDAVPQINDVSVMLQTGRDAEAMSVIVRFTELLGKIVRIIPYLSETNSELLVDRIEGADLSETANELNGFLNELVAAFGAQDSVLIGDLLEYEIAPKVQRLVQFFET
jgi:hypothetical protein